MTKLTTKERFTRMHEHRDADRVPIIDYPWPATIERWQSEGLPKDMDYVDYFDIDHYVLFSTDNSPRFEEKTIEETDEYITTQTSWGTTLRNWKHAASTPEFLDFTIVDPDSWKKAKEKMVPSKDRIDWKHLEKNYKNWREKGKWLLANMFFGFDVTHSWVVGTERILMAMIEKPDWVRDMFSHQLEVDLALLDMIWNAGYEFDSIFWCDDMGYKGTQFRNEHYNKTEENNAGRAFEHKIYRVEMKPFRETEQSSQQ